MTADAEGNFQDVKTALILVIVRRNFDHHPTLAELDVVNICAGNRVADTDPEQFVHHVNCVVNFLHDLDSLMESADVVFHEPLHELGAAGFTGLAIFMGKALHHEVTELATQDAQGFDPFVVERADDLLVSFRFAFDDDALGRQGLAGEDVQNALREAVHEVVLFGEQHGFAIPRGIGVAHDLPAEAQRIAVVARRRLFIMNCGPHQLAEHRRAIGERGGCFGELLANGVIHFVLLGFVERVVFLTEDFAGVGHPCRRSEQMFRSRLKDDAAFGLVGLDGLFRFRATRGKCSIGDGGEDFGDVIGIDRRGSDGLFHSLVRVVCCFQTAVYRKNQRRFRPDTTILYGYCQCRVCDKNISC